MDKVLNAIPFSYDYDSHKLVKRTPDWAGVGRGLAIGGAGSIGGSVSLYPHGRGNAGQIFGGLPRGSESTVQPGSPLVYPPFSWDGLPSPRWEILRKICAKNLAQSLRQEFLRKICAKNSCAKFAPRILAPNLRQEFLRQICARNPAQPGRDPPHL